MGYDVVDKVEFWEYKVTCLDNDSNAGGLFAEYVNLLLQLKQNSSGKPSSFQIEEDILRYFEGYRRAEGIARTRRVLYTRRNSFTSFLHVRVPRLQTSYSRMTSWMGHLKYSEVIVAAGKNVNVAVGASVTTQAQLKLYEDLSKLKQSV